MDIDNITQSINDARNMTYRLRDLCTDTGFQQTDSFGIRTTCQTLTKLH